MIDRDALCNQVFLDHFDQVVGFSVLRCRSGFQPLRIEIGLAAQLVDPLRHGAHVFGFFLRVLVELLLYAVAGNAGRRNGMHRVSEHANDFSGQHRLQNVDRLLGIALVRMRDAAVPDILAGAIAQGLYVGQKGQRVLCG